MILLLVQFAAVSFVVLYLGLWIICMHRRNAQSWESLIARLRPDLSAHELSEHFPRKEGLSATPDEKWRRIEGVRRLHAISQNSGVMLELADFASRYSDSVDPMLLQTLRSDAMQIRFCAFTALFKLAF
jgi:hypothetical protein